MTIHFTKDGYDPFIDFIKAYAIICVLLGHTLPNLKSWGYPLWAGMQVPLFLLVQTFHCYKKKENKINIKKLITRILLPFIIAETLIFVCLLFSGGDINSILHRFAIGGGLGPGSYYPWIYLQFAILLPLFQTLFSKFSKKIISITFLSLAILAEVVCAIVDLPNPIYRLLALRYLFLIYLGWLWVQDGVKINRVTVILSFLSFASIIFFTYFPRNLEPVFYNTTWYFHRWPCYIWVANLGIYMLYKFWKLSVKSNHLTNIVKKLARSSYEIFLVQMVLIGIGTKNMFAQNIGVGYVAFALWILFIILGSIVIGIIIRNCIDSYSQKNLLIKK